MVAVYVIDIHVVSYISNIRQCYEHYLRIIKSLVIKYKLYAMYHSIIDSITLFEPNIDQICDSPNQKLVAKEINDY